MESSAPKRRRTSPRTAVPLPAPDDSNPESTTPKDSPPKPAEGTKRPSYASPTRASLQRHNPDIIRRRTISPKRKRSDQPDEYAPPLLPQPLGDEDEDDLLNPFAGRALARSPVPLAPEPDLPPTPEHPDPVVSTPPSGIHNTPSKRPKRSKELAERLKSSSPLKQPAIRPSKSQLGMLSHPIQDEASASSATMTTVEMRGLPPIDPDAQKKYLRDQLSSQVKELERDLEIITAESERIHRAVTSKSQVPPPPNKHELEDLLRRHALPSKDKNKRDPDTQPGWLEAASNPIAFLPFSKPSSHPSSEGLQGPFHLTDPSVEETPPEPISHHPLTLPLKEGLSYLQLFTPLEFDLLITPLHRSSPSDPIIMRHNIDVRTQSPLSTPFSAKIVADVNTKTLAVVSLSVPRLYPAAVSELTPFIKSICSSEGKPNSSASTNNISTLGWSMAEWVRVAVRRAHFWRTLDQELSGSNKAGLITMVRSLRAGRGKKGAGKEPSLRRRRRQNGDNEETEVGEDFDVGGHAGDVSLDRTRAWPLSGYMGQTVMDYQIPALSPSASTTQADQGKKTAGAKGKGKQISSSAPEDSQDISSLQDSDDVTSTLRVQWRIEFEWTGEARSDISIMAGVPGKWYQFDERGQLAGLPKLFDDLIQGGEDPIDAVRTIVSLLTGDPGPEGNDKV